MGTVAMLPLLIILVAFWLLRPPIASASYLEVPRIHFAGQFRADPNTRNNINCNFDLNYPISNDTGRDYDINGTGEFSFFDCKVTSVVNEDGVFDDSDSAVNALIFNNENMPVPKFVDIDVDYQLIKASIFGMNFGVKWKGDNGLAFRGDWQLSVIAQDLWSRYICANVTPRIEDHRQGAKTVTRLTNVEWGNVSRSPVLQQLKKASAENGGDLSVSMSIHFYTRTTPIYILKNFTLGYVVGAIGIARRNEPLNFNGNRLLSFEDVTQPRLPLAENDSCYYYQQNKKPHPHWMYKAPFQVCTQHERVSVDFSNSFPFDLLGGMRDLGNLWLGIINGKKDNCIELIGELLRHHDDDWLTKTGGVVDYKLTFHQFQLLETSRLVVARVTPPLEEMWHQDAMKTASAPLKLYVGCSEDQNIIEIMLQENPKFIRPMDYYVSRLDYNECFEVRFLVTNYGKPVVNVSVHVFLSNKPIPLNGVVPMSLEAPTDESGIATFTFRVNNNVEIPFPRQYHQPPCNFSHSCTLPIEGQVYMFKYHTNGTCIHDVSNFVTGLTCVNDIAILAFSHKPESQQQSEPNWTKHVEPIFKQYDRLYPVMHKMINLANYTSVIQPHNLELLKYAMSLDISHPSYMPVTRDLSPTNRKMILAWIDKKIKETHPSKHITPLVPTCDHPRTMAAVRKHEKYLPPPDPRCNATELTFDSTPYDDDAYFMDIFTVDTTVDRNPPRPLWQYHLKRMAGLQTKKCSLEHLRAQLQQAVELEFATIPVYLTSLYSIVEGYNTEVYQLIRSVVMQEMLHMTQAANILIALSGQPKIDSNETVPNFPTNGTKLPGGVLPNLTVHLKKASLEHIYTTFMGIEVPHIVLIDELHPEIFNDTIGQFYKEIERCIEDLSVNNTIFNASRANEQIKWPWVAPAVGTVHIVTDVQSAKQAIEEIVEQGEGAGPMDPNDESGKLAHFYRFEEVVCQHHLCKTADKYAYNGSLIPFDPAGVWPMRDNPGKGGIDPNTNCYTEAKVFHKAYRALLRKLQSVFDGKPDGIMDAITIMESLSAHARRVMWTKFHAGDDVTCGPVWDYDWDE